MKVILLDELRDTRRRLAEEQMLDVERYAAMLRIVPQWVRPGRVLEKGGAHTPRSLVPPLFHLAFNARWGHLITF